MVERIVNLKTVRELMDSVHSGINVGEVRYLSEGWDNWLYLVNQDLVVRIAKTPPGDGQLLREATVLSGLAPTMNMHIPHPEFVHVPSAALPFAAMGYYLVPGDSMNPDDATGDRVETLAPDLARFLSELRAIPVDVARRWAVPEFTPHEWLESHDRLVRGVADVLRKRLSPATYERVRNWWAEYRSDPVAVAYEPCFIHGDLGCEHVLIDRNTWRVTGIIDFGDARIADPALDLAGFPDDLARAVMRLMPNLYDAESIWQRSVVYRLFVPFHAVFTGIDRSDETLIGEGIDGLTQRFSR